tara:strand:+ start:932 stop:1123 length:192 start_codon:yes stop_codon:yes gene_type:complete
MSQIEEVMYEALDLNLTREVFEEVRGLKSKEENKFVSLDDIYYLAFINAKLKQISNKGEEIIT